MILCVINTEDYAMQLMQVTQQKDLEAEAKRRFTEFHQQHATYAGRRYPPELISLVRQVADAGVESARLGKLIGVHHTTLCRWLGRTPKVKKPARRVQPLQNTPPRKIAVVAPAQKASIVVRFPSGISIEMDGLSADLLASLARLEVSDASSR
jgi:hypothetical protein